MSDDPGYDRIDKVAKLAGKLGFNETRVRWKLLRMREQRAEAAERARTAASHVRYEHAVCGHCGRILDRSARQCPSCGSKLEPRWVQMLRRAGMHAPVPLSVSTLIVAVILLAFVRQVIAGGGSFFAFQGQDLLRLGAHYPLLEQSGEWWRLGTAVLLHGGILHLLFNVFALSQVGPGCEDAFGPGRTLFFFVVIGIAANVPSLLMDRANISIGASGAVLGMAGLAAGWGQREGTTIGRSIRNSMVMWLVYTTLFGLMMRVDHSAHISGFACGFVLGFASHGVRKRQGSADAILGLVGFVALLVLLGLVLFPPESRFLMR